MNHYKTITSFLPFFFGVFCFFTISCTKNKAECERTCTNGGILNSEVCVCNCQPGYLGDNCEVYDATKVQWLLDNGETPKKLLAGGISIDSIYGKYYSDGYIFHLDPINGSGMVVALSDYIPYAPTLWGCPTENISGISNVSDCHGSSTCFQPIPVETELGVRIGDGFENTNYILALCSDTTNAAFLCRSLGANWFLPSRGELNLMYVNLHAKGLGDFEDHSFLSSSEGLEDYHIWVQLFTNGQITGSDKFVAMDFRAVKEF